MRLNKYFARIGYSESPQCNLHTLRSIQFAHATSIPFENFDPFCGKQVSLEIDTIQKKLVDQKRGGYCFEQNNLLSWALREIGFSVESFQRGFGITVQQE